MDNYIFSVIIQAWRIYYMTIQYKKPRGEQKVRINLSSTALDIIRYDLELLNSKRKASKLPLQKTGTIFNEIFSVYYPVADASIHLALDKKMEEYHEILDLNSSENNSALVLLRNNLEKKLISKALSYEKGESLTFRLNNDNYDYLEEYQWPLSKSEYVKAVLEEYARLPFIEREPLLYKKYFDIIKTSIQNGYRLKVTLQNDKVHIVYPYAIKTDLSETAHYLVCSSINTETRKKEPHSFRISGLKKIESSPLSGKLTKEDKKHIEQELQKKGVQFLSYADNPTIKIRLTPHGKQMYHNSTHLRPPYDAELSKDDIYVFHCTEFQARFYFVKFGEHAEVLEPKELREKFKTIYAKAFNVYNKK